MIKIILLIILILSIRIGKCQELYQPTSIRNRYEYIEYPYSASNFLNPSIICENDGQEILVGKLTAISGKAKTNYLSVNSVIIESIYFGYSLIDYGTSIDQNAPAYDETFHTLSAAFKLPIDKTVLKYISAGINLNYLTFNLFGLEKFNSKSLDVGINTQLIDNDKIKLKSGLAFQNLISSKIERSNENYEPLSESIDFSLWIIFYNRFYISRTANILNKETSFNSDDIFSLKRLIYGLKTCKYHIVKIKHTPDERTMLGNQLMLPLNNFSKKLECIYSSLEIEIFDREKRTGRLFNINVGFKSELF